MQGERCRRRCNEGIDPVFARALAETLNDMFVVQSLIFRKPATLFGFHYTRKCYVEIPKMHSDNYDKTQIVFCKECINLLDYGWENDIARVHEKHMRKMLLEVDNG